MKKIFSLSLLVTIILISSVVFATTNFNAILEPNKKIIKENDELEVILKLDNFTPGEKGINVFIATLDYDKNVFEEVQSYDLVSIENWENPVYNYENGTFLIDASKFVDVTHNALKINFKVKSQIGKIKSTKISLKDITASDGETDIEVVPVETKIAIEKTIINKEKQVAYIVGIGFLVIVISSVVIVVVKRRKSKK